MGTILELLCERGVRALRRFGLLGFLASVLLAVYVELPLELSAMQSTVRAGDGAVLHVIRSDEAKMRAAQSARHPPGKPSRKP